MSASLTGLLWEWLRAEGENRFVPGPYLRDFAALRSFADGFLTCHSMILGGDSEWSRFVAGLREAGVIVGTEDVFDALLAEAGQDPSKAIGVFRRLLIEHCEKEQ